MGPKAGSDSASQGRSAPLLPLDRARRLRRIVVDHAVDALHLVDDPGRDAAEESRVERVDVGGHSVRRGDGAKAADIIDRKSTRLNSSHLVISYAVFCLKKKIS